MAFVALLKPLVRISSHITIDYNEGWNAYFADQAVKGQQIYQPLDALVLNNYPPLSFHIVGSMGRIVGDTIIGGRILSLIGLMVVAIMVAAIVHRCTGSLFYGTTGALLLLGYMGVYHSDYIGMNDPQWLAQGCMLTGLVVFLHRQRLRHGLMLAALIMMLAGFMKHSFLAIPLGCTLWLWVFERGTVLRWLAVSGLFLATGLLSLYFAYGWQAFVDIFACPRAYYIGLLAWAGDWLQPATLYIVCSVFLALVDRSREIRLLLIITLTSLIIGVFALGGTGIYKNMLFEFVSLIITLSAIGLNRLENHAKGGQMALVLGVLALALPFAMLLPRQVYITRNWIKELPAIQRATADDVDRVARVSGPVMCENLAVSYWARKPFSVDNFTLGQKVMTGKMDPRLIDDLIDRKHFALIQLDDSEGKSYRLPAGTLKKILEKYSLGWISRENGMFLVR